MDLPQKVGQLLVFGFSGAVPHRDVMEIVSRVAPAGLRVVPRSRKFTRYFGPDHPGYARVIRKPERTERVYAAAVRAPRVSPEFYANTLNTLRQCSLESGARIPLYFCTDYEGNVVADFASPQFFGVPHPMGLAASGDVDLCRRVALLVARQLKAIGIDWIHSPVVSRLPT